MKFCAHAASYGANPRETEYRPRGGVGSKKRADGD